MSLRKDYRRAAQVVKDLYLDVYARTPMMGYYDDGEPIHNIAKPLAVETAFVRFFAGEPNTRFKAQKFRDACKPNEEEKAVVRKHEELHREFQAMPKQTNLGTVSQSNVDELCGMLRDAQKPKKRTRKTKAK
jgi:hypothetical protein